jgi:hypothetical protein
MRLLMGEVQSTSSVDFFGMDINGDCAAIDSEDERKRERRRGRVDGGLGFPKFDHDTTLTV